MFWFWKNVSFTKVVFHHTHNVCGNFEYVHKAFLMRSHLKSIISLDNNPFENNLKNITFSEIVSIHKEIVIEHTIWGGKIKKLLLLLNTSKRIAHSLYCFTLKIIRFHKWTNKKIAYQRWMYRLINNICFMPFEKLFRNL